MVGVAASATEAKTGAVTYSLADDASGRFAIDAATGVVSVADATKLNFETSSSHQITVRATGAQGLFSSRRSSTIAVTNVANTPPTDGDGATNTISEGAVNGSRGHRPGDQRQRRQRRPADLQPCSTTPAAGSPSTPRRVW
ncbi:cadherin repeat domain-containing protein [Caulobacter segnis]